METAVARLSADLKRLGLRPGDRVMMHSSLSALGPVDGGAETVVNALFDAIGSEGTLLVPAFRDSVWGDPERFGTPGCDCLSASGLCICDLSSFQGIISETVRRRPGSLRSCHPTHSWVAFGPDAERLLARHRESPTPCGRGNPFEELVRLDGCVLTLGVQVNTVTLWHYYEEILELPYMGHYWPKERHLNHCVSGLRIQYEFPGLMQDVCRASGILQSGLVGKGASGLMRARTFGAFMGTILVDDPYSLVLRPPSRDCGDLAVDAMQKAAAMLLAWKKGPVKEALAFGFRPLPVRAPFEDDLVRQDCPAFAGFHEARGAAVPLCRANGRHPDYFREGGPFASMGPAQCVNCSWHAKFPPKRGSARLVTARPVSSPRDDRAAL